MTLIVVFNGPLTPPPGPVPPPIPPVVVFADYGRGATGIAGDGGTVLVSFIPGQSDIQGSGRTGFVRNPGGTGVPGAGGRTRIR